MRVRVCAERFSASLHLADLLGQPETRSYAVNVLVSVLARSRAPFDASCISETFPSSHQRTLHNCLALD